MSFRWWSSCDTHLGRRRRINEDNYFAHPEGGIWVVADGMGGHTRGDRASQHVIATIRAIPQTASLDELVKSTCDALRLANKLIRDEAQSLGENVVMGSTVVVLLVRGAEFACLWAGDSRIYRLRGDHLRQLTKDHSRVQELIDDGTITRTEAKSHPSANRITRAVGALTTLAIDEIRGTIRDGDKFLLCSDGLVLEVDDDEIATLLDDRSSREAVEEMIELCLERGARDNVTVGVVQVEETTGVDWANSEVTAVNYSLRRDPSRLTVQG